MIETMVKTAGTRLGGLKQRKVELSLSVILAIGLVAVLLSFASRWGMFGKTYDDITNDKQHQVVPKEPISVVLPEPLSDEEIQYDVPLTTPVYEKAMYVCCLTEANRASLVRTIDEYIAMVKETNDVEYKIVGMEGYEDLAEIALFPYQIDGVDIDNVEPTLLMAQLVDGEWIYGAWNVTPQETKEYCRILAEQVRRNITFREDGLGDPQATYDYTCPSDWIDNL